MKREVLEVSIALQEDNLTALDMLRQMPLQIAWMICDIELTNSIDNQTLHSAFSELIMDNLDEAKIRNSMLIADAMNCKNCFHLLEEKYLEICHKQKIRILDALDSKGVDGRKRRM